LLFISRLSLHATDIVVPRESTWQIVKISVSIDDEPRSHWAHLHGLSFCRLLWLLGFERWVRGAVVINLTVYY